MNKIKKKLEKYEIKCIDSFNKYLKLVSKNDEESVYTEKHHICPKSMFPEYEKCKWNIVKLSYENHIKAHELLLYMYDNGSMKKAYSFITLHKMDDRMKYLTSGAFKGNANPSKRKDVREKIRKSKLGVPRLDLKNKKYFGSSDETIEKIIEKNSKFHKNKIIVKYKNCKDNKYFKVDKNDERYLRGELVIFNKGLKPKRLALHSKEFVDKVINKRNKTYEKFNNMSFEEIVCFLLESNNKGKNIFSKGVDKKRPFSKNYSGYVNRTGFNQIEVF